MPDPTDARMYDAIESALWQDLADALNRLQEHGLDPIAGLAEHLNVRPITDIDAGAVIHGGSPREGGYLLRWDGLGSAWAVAPRDATEMTA